MYFPLSWPKQLIAHNDDCPLACVAASYDRFLFAVLTQKTVGIWFCKVVSYLQQIYYVVEKWCVLRSSPWQYIYEYCFCVAT